MVQFIIYTLLVSPMAVEPPNNTAVLLLATAVRVKLLIGGGLSPETVGVIHSPN